MSYVNGYNPLEEECQHSGGREQLAPQRTGQNLGPGSNLSAQCFRGGGTVLGCLTVPSEQGHTMSGRPFRVGVESKRVVTSKGNGREKAIDIFIEI